MYCAVKTHIATGSDDGLNTTITEQSPFHVHNQNVWPVTVCPLIHGLSPVAAVHKEQPHSNVSAVTVCQLQLQVLSVDKHSYL